jgi:hypothetical protein
MNTIPIQVSGDRWNNVGHVQHELNQTQPGDTVMLDLCSEGPSLHRIGLVNMLSQYQLQVRITRWSNAIEAVPFHRDYCNPISHFFPMSHHYWIDEIANNCNAPHRLAVFQGRGTPSRNRILYDVLKKFREHFLISKMQCKTGDAWGIQHLENQRPLETLQQWFDDPRAALVWLDQCQLTSIDNHIVQDQFVIPEISAGNMARSLLAHYDRFNVELVCETYTLGETFFVTEKTVRPIVGNRPFLVYGPINYLNNLRQIGFETFSDIWDESYDELEGEPRWQAMQQVIKHMISLPNDNWCEVLQQCQIKTQHNRNLLKQIIHDRKAV